MSFSFKQSYSQKKRAQSNYYKLSNFFSVFQLIRLHLHQLSERIKKEALSKLYTLLAYTTGFSFKEHYTLDDN